MTRGFGLLRATALNMSNVVGVGPFIAIPLMLAAMGGPQAAGVAVLFVRARLTRTWPCELGT